MYVGEGETVHVLLKFTEPGGDPTVKGGRYMVHCHNFVHEDHDMMGQFSVGSVDFDTDPHTRSTPRLRARIRQREFRRVAGAGRTMKMTLVRYQAKLERTDENQQLIEAVFTDLAGRKPQRFTYNVSGVRTA